MIVSVLDIVTFPDNFLKKTTRLVENVDGELQTLIENMATTMYDAPGLGLAAIQVGVDQSLLVYDIKPSNEGRELNVLINPKIIAKEGELLSEDEGCLSVPDFRASVKRAGQVLVEALDRDGNPKRIEAQGLHAILLQHEIDHLNGILFIDRISALKRQIYVRRIKKQLKQQNA